LSDFYDEIESQKKPNFDKINPEKNPTLTVEQKKDLSVLNYKSISEVQEKLYSMRKYGIKELASDFETIQEKIKCKRLF